MKAQFHKNQRVYVKPVGTWALVERVAPHWTKGLDEPLRIVYDCGLGRDFQAEELQSEEPLTDSRAPAECETWRVVRARNKWQAVEDCVHHPVPGTYPVVVTGDTEWGGWRVPGAEYDLDPNKIEHQARQIALSPRLVAFAKALVRWTRESGEDIPTSLSDLAHEAQDIVSAIERGRNG